MYPSLKRYVLTAAAATSEGATYRRRSVSISRSQDGKRSRASDDRTCPLEELAELGDARELGAQAVADSLRRHLCEVGEGVGKGLPQAEDVGQWEVRRDVQEELWGEAEERGGARFQQLGTTSQSSTPTSWPGENLLASHLRASRAKGERSERKSTASSPCATEPQGIHTSIQTSNSYTPNATQSFAVASFCTSSPFSITSLTSVHASSRY